jgi:hypothetical protein
LPRLLQRVSSRSSNVLAGTLPSLPEAITDVAVRGVQFCRVSPAAAVVRVSGVSPVAEVSGAPQPAPAMMSRVSARTRSFFTGESLEGLKTDSGGGND